MKKLGKFTDQVTSAVGRVVETFFLYLVVIILTPAFMALIVMPGIGVIYACTRWVLAVPGASSWYPTAFGGLFVGVYLLPLSLLNGTFARRLSTRVARMRPVRVDEALPRQFVAIDATVVGGRPADAAPFPKRSPADEWVSYPLVLQDEAGEVLRVPHWNGVDQPIDEGAVRYGVVRVGHRVVAVGEVRRDEPGSTLYRVPARGPRLVRGEAPYFGVREGNVASLAAVLRIGETSPAWGIFSLAAIALGLGSIIAAQSAAPPWFP